MEQEGPSIEPEKIQRIVGWIFIYFAFFCLMATFTASREDRLVWAIPTVLFVVGGLTALAWSYRKKKP